MFKYNRIVAVRRFCSTKQIGQRLIKFALSKLHPTEAIQIRGVVWFLLERAFNHCLSFIKIHVVIRPHVTQVIARLCRIGWIERDRLVKQLSRFVVQPSLLGRSSIVEVKLRIYYVVILVQLRFVQCLFESRHGLLALLRFALRDRQIINNLRRAGKSAPSFCQQLHRPGCVF